MLDIASITKKISEMEEKKEIKIRQFYNPKYTSDTRSIFEDIKQIDLMIHNSYFELATLKMKIL
jgi:hypothetical protein